MGRRFLFHSTPEPSFVRLEELHRGRVVSHHHVDEDVTEVDAVDAVLLRFLNSELDAWLPPPPRVPAFAAETVRPGRMS